MIASTPSAPTAIDLVVVAESVAESTIGDAQLISSAAAVGADLSTIPGLAVQERDVAAELGVTHAVLLQHAARDHRILAAEALEGGGAARLGRWLAAGAPAPDLKRLQYRGSDEVREHVVEPVLRRVPAAVSHFGVESIFWREVGRDCNGWAGVHLPPRTVDGDQPLEIELCGALSNEELRSVAAHELAHQWTRLIAACAPALIAMSHRETLARQLVLARELGVDDDYIVTLHVDGEQLADDLAGVWGFARRTDRRAIRERRVAELDACRPLAAALATRGIDPTSGLDSAPLNADKAKP